MKRNYLLLVICLAAYFSNAQTINFADPEFKNYLLNNFGIYDQDYNPVDIDVNNDNEIQQSEALLVHRMTFDYVITNAEGLQYFTNLESFYFEGGNPALTTLNLSTLTNMREITIKYTSITNFSFSGNSLLSLELNYNALSGLDLSPLAGSSLITDVALAYNNIGFIDLSPLQNCTNLNTIRLNGNALTTIDWSPFNSNSNTNITEINLRDNQITTFDFSQVGNAVNRIDLSQNQLNELNFSGLDHPLQALHLENNPYEYFDTAGLVHVDTLTAGSESLHDAKFTVYDFDYVNLSGENINTIDFKNGNNEACFSIYLLCPFHPQFVTFVNPNQIMCVDDFPNMVEEGPSIVDKSEKNYWNRIINGEPAAGPVFPELGPHITTYCSEEPGGGFNTIAGNVKFDCGNANTNLFQVPVHITESGFESATTTNVSGDFRLYTTAQANVIVTPDLQNLPFFNVTPANYTFNFASTGNTQTANFCLTPNGIHSDIEVSLYAITAARPGFDAQYLIVYKNNGNQVASGSVTLNFNDTLIDFINANPTLSAQNGNILTWNYANLGPFESRNITITLNINSPMETPPVNLSDELIFTAEVNVDQADEMPNDNQAALHQIVVGSFDPNDKQVCEGAQVNIDEADEYLHYIIRFENTGTAVAENVVIEDYLESDLDPTTLQVVSASHPYRATLSNGNQFEVFFTGINLPASIDSQSESRGYVAFKIKPRSTVVVGTQISNKANIHFDFNFPIVTNTTTTTFSLLATQNFAQANGIAIFPNPAENRLNIRNNASEKINSVQIYNLLGQMLYSNEQPQNEWSIDVSGLQTGHYLIKMGTEKGTSTQHFIKK